MTRTDPTMNQLQPNKLMLSKWTAVKPIAKQKHFLVSKVIEPDQEGGKVEWIDLEAVHSKATRRMAWQPEFDSSKPRNSYIPNGINRLAALFRILVVARFKL